MNKKILTAAALTLMLVGGAISLAACNHKNVNVGTNGTTASSTDATTETKVTINTKDVDKDYWKNLVGDDHNVTITSKDKNTDSKSDKTSGKTTESNKNDKVTAGKTDKKTSENVSEEPKATTEKPTEETTQTPTTQPTEEPTTEKTGCSHNWVTETVKAAWDEKVIDEPARTENICTKKAYDERKLVGCKSIHNVTGEDMTNTDYMAWCEAHDCAIHFLGDGPCACDTHTEEVYETIHHDAEYTTKTIPEKSHTVHHDAVYKTYCSKCGATK